MGSPLARRQEDGTWSVVVQPAYRRGHQLPAAPGDDVFYYEEEPVPARVLTWDPAEGRFSERPLTDDVLEISATDPPTSTVAFATTARAGRAKADGGPVRTRRIDATVESLDVAGNMVVWCDGERVFWWPRGGAVRRVRLGGARLVDLDGEHVLIGTPEGVYAWDPGDPPRVLASGAVVALAAEDGRLAVVLADGTLRLFALDSSG